MFYVDTIAAGKLKGGTEMTDTNKKWGKDNAPYKHMYCYGISKSIYIFFLNRDMEAHQAETVK